MHQSFDLAAVRDHPLTAAPSIRQGLGSPFSSRMSSHSRERELHLKAKWKAKFGTLMARRTNNFSKQKLAQRKQAQNARPETTLNASTWATSPIDRPRFGHHHQFSMPQSILNQTVLIHDQSQEFGVPSDHNRTFNLYQKSYDIGRRPPRQDIDLQSKKSCQIVPRAQLNRLQNIASLASREESQVRAPSESATPVQSESAPNTYSSEASEDSSEDSEVTQSLSTDEFNASTPRLYQPEDSQEEVPTCLKQHSDAYEQSCRNAMFTDLEQEFKKAINFLTKTGISAIKYNYALEDKVQNYQTYKCKLTLEGDNFNVTIFKPVISQVQNEVEGESTNVYSPTTFIEKLSSASCKVSDIQAITVGAQASRFWMFRKHVNSIPIKQAHQVPFFAWECITIHLSHRSLDLVVRDEKELRILLRFLVYTLKTVDGSRNSAEPLIEAITKQEIRNGGLSRRLVSFEKASEQLRREVEHKVLNKTLKGFRMLIIRNKISFSAHLKGFTVMELFLRTILKTLYFLGDNKVINVNRGQDKAFDDIFNPQTREGKIGSRFMVMSHVIRQLAISNEGAHLMQSVVREEKPQTSKKYGSVGAATNDFIRKYFQKDEVIEILRDVPQANKNVDKFEHWNYKRFFNYKVNMKSCDVILRRISLFVALGLMKGLLYLKVMIRRIELKKEKLILEVEQGKEVFIDRDLSLDRLPPSFRFYDFLLRFISENVADDRKEYYGLKKGLKVQLNQMFQANYFLQKFGLVEQDEDEKLVFKLQMNDPDRQYNIDFHRSEHTMDVQRSKYVGIDNDMTFKPDRVVQEQPQTIQQQRENPQSINNVKYSLQRQVAKNQHEYLKFKTTYAAKQAHIKSQGQKLQIISKVENWIDEHLPQLIERSKVKMDMYKQEKLRSNILKMAEDMVMKQRHKHRVHIFEKLKGLFLGNEDSDHKSVQIDKIIAYDTKFFNYVSEKQQFELNQIQKEQKRVEKRITRRISLFDAEISRLLPSPKTPRTPLPTMPLKTGASTAKAGRLQEFQFKRTPGRGLDFEQRL